MGDVANAAALLPKLTEPAVKILSHFLKTISPEIHIPRIFVHMSAMLGLSGFLSSNVVTLRTLSVLSSLAALCFNLFKQLYSAVVWNVVFMSINLGRIWQLLCQDKNTITMNLQEQNLYELAFMTYNVPLQDFKQLLLETSAEWFEYEAGQTIVSQGDPMPVLRYVVDGAVEVTKNQGSKTVSVLRPGKGGWLGELWDPNQDKDYWNRPHHWLAGFRAREHCTVVAFARQPLHNFIASRPHMRAAANAAEVADLWGKLRSTHVQSSLNTYRGMVQIANVDGEVEPGEKSLLEQYANEHSLGEQDLHQVQRELIAEWRTQINGSGHTQVNGSGDTQVNGSGQENGSVASQQIKG